ncbi:MAG TPA: hypothetical protein VFY68_09015 [Nitrososphaeraceae archaeon]|nr:hypothetical protein [Nitrososphaeraceae archaeon]
MMTSFYHKYKDNILFNKNLLISGIISFLVGALFTQIYAQYEENHVVNSLVTLIIGYAVYLPLFAFLFYRDNKAKYVDSQSGKKNSSRIKNDVKKLFTAFSISEAIFVVSKTYIHYSLLVSSAEPYQAYAIAEFVSWVIYFISINVGTKAVKLFENKSDLGK